MTISGSSVIEIVTDPLADAVPSNVTSPPTIAYVLAPALIVSLAIVIDNGFPEAISGTEPSAANQATTNDTTNPPAGTIKLRALDKSLTR